MFRRIVATVVAIAFSLSFVSSFSVARAMDAGSPATNLAPAEVASQATSTLTLFLKRAGSSKPDVRHRAWEMLTPDLQQQVFYGLEEAFYAVGGKILQTEDITIDQYGNVVVPVALKGFWGKYSFTNTAFALTSDTSMINGITILDDLTVPDGLTSTKLTIKMSDDSISTRRKPLVEHDVVLVTLTNTGTITHRVVLLRVPDGTTPDALTATITGRDAVNDPLTVAMIPAGQSQTIALMGMDEGTYLIAGVPSGGQSETETLVGVFTTLTITK